MLPIIGDALKKELAAIEAGGHGENAKHWLPVLKKLINSSHCEQAWRIAAKYNFNSLDGQVYLARAVLAALIMGEYDYSKRSQDIEKVKRSLKELQVDNYLVTKILRKFDIEEPWASRKSGENWPRACFVYLTGLALYKLDSEVHAIEVMWLTNESKRFDDILDSNVRKLLENIDQIAESHTAVPTVSIRYTPNSKE